MVMTHRIAAATTAPARGTRSSIVAGVVLALLAGALLGFVLAGGFSAGQARNVSARVLEAWQTGDPATVESAYAYAAVLVIDGETVASDRDELAAVLEARVAAGDTVRPLGSVSEYTGPDGDVYVSSMVEMVDADSRDAAPYVVVYHVRDGRVARQVLTSTEER